MVINLFSSFSNFSGFYLPQQYFKINFFLEGPTVELRRFKLGEKSSKLELIRFNLGEKKTLTLMMFPPWMMFFP